MDRRDFIRDSMLTGLALSLPGTILGQPLPNGESAFLKIIPDPSSLQFQFFSIDSLGKNNLETNLSLAENLDSLYTTTIRENITSYHHGTQPATEKPAWEFIQDPNSFLLRSYFNEENNQSFVINIEQHVNHCTLLGMMEETGIVKLPAILHFPDRGTLRITGNKPGMTLQYSSQRFIEHPFVKILLPPAKVRDAHLEYQFQVISIYPETKDTELDSRYDGFRKNFISIFQLNPLLKILSNNSSSDACAFTLYKYAEVAAVTPPLANGLSALDLVRMTLNRYLDGQLGYGMLGYDYDKTWDIPETPTTCNTLDSYPSLLIAACTYIIANKDRHWFLENEKGIKAWASKMLASDKDDDGLLEFCLSGNSGSWKGDKTQRPSNWWDTIGFGYKDAYSNALAYRALTLLANVHDQYGSGSESRIFAEKAAKLKSAYTAHFYNPATHILAGWKSADGELHDYYFTFVNGVAISYDLIETTMANDILDRLLLKMKEVGFQNFKLGMPGNLIPVKRSDYTDLLPEVGGGKREDNLDGFQIYENGGATACFTYFTIHALLKLGRKKDADLILFPLLESMSEGNFQGRCSNGRSKDWKTWTGECWGYEGFLVDNYMFLLAVWERSRLK